MTNFRDSVVKLINEFSKKDLKYVHLWWSSTCTTSDFYVIFYEIYFNTNVVVVVVAVNVI